MAYQAKRRKRFEEEFELVNEFGEVEQTLHVSLDADDMAGKISRKYAELAKTLTETTEANRLADNAETTADCIEKLGNAVVTLFEAVFGTEDAKKIVDFYDGRYIEMCREVTPFITNVVIRRCIEIKNENQKAILQKYNRKQWAAIAKRVRK